ncbi:molybdate ABC transporter substrate-binding protein [Cellulomonas endophytica]|uniref:molybdate ABC transporter substrate-binding protein n=1 Tax=Cellulomonas endophytica TaxID=2494735 RepID=UPI001F0BD618|nr:molybdate ABC transporter substrate-binding protein [Cellulomonas endophytica]
MAVALLAACGPGAATGPALEGRTGPATAAPGSPTGPEALTGELVVLAAASLTEATAALVDRFTAEHPGVTVTTGFGGSSSLAAQLVAGAPADVFVAASAETMAPVTEAFGGTARVVARNVLELVVPAGNPGGVTGLADLADPELAVALCAPGVPCGAAAATLLASAGVTAAPDTLERDVSAVLAKVRLGEVDAGLVYATDVRRGGDAVEGVPVPGAEDVVNDYPALVLPGAANPAAAEAFVALLLSDEGRRVLRDAGFRPR